MNLQQEIEEFNKSQREHIEKSIATPIEDAIEKAQSHKYFKREGTPGNYKYYYTEADYKAGKSNKYTKDDIRYQNEQAEIGRKNAEKEYAQPGSQADKEHNKRYEGSEKKINKSILKELGFELSEIQPTSYQDSKSILSHDIRVNKGYSKEEIEGKIKSLMKREFPDRLTGVKIFNFGSYTDIVMSVTRPDSTSRRDNQARAWGLS